MLASVEPLGVDAAVLAEKELGRARKREEVLVERRGEPLDVPEHDRRRAADGGHVSLGEVDELHHLADEPRHVGRRQVAGLDRSSPRRRAPPVVHAPSIPAGTRGVKADRARWRGGLTFGGAARTWGNGRSVSSEESGSLSCLLPAGSTRPLAGDAPGGRTAGP